MGKSLGFNIAAGMMQGLGAGIIENAKQKREAALRAMEITARQQEGQADRASREAMSANELGSREAISTKELGMRGNELAESRAEREQREKESGRRWEADREDRKDYRAEINADRDASRGMRPTSDKVTDKDIIESIITEVEKSKDSLGKTKVRSEDLAARYPDRPEVLKRFGVTTDPTGRPTAPAPQPGPGQAGPAAAAAPAKKLPPESMLKVDEIKADYRAKVAKATTEAERKSLLEDANRQINALMK